MSWTALRCTGEEREEQELLERELATALLGLEKASMKSSKLESRSRELKKKANKDARLIGELRDRVIDL